MRIILSVILVKFSCLVLAQSPLQNKAFNHNSENFWITEERQDFMKSVFRFDAVSNYGVDFSFLRVNEDSTVYAEDMHTFIADWQSTYQQQCFGLKADSKLRKTLRKDAIVRVAEDVQNSYKQNEDWLSRGRPLLNHKAIKDIVNSYPKTEKENLGFVVIADRIDVTTGLVHMNYVLFNTRSGVVFWYVKMQAPMKNAFISKKVSAGMIATFFRFRKHYGKQRRKHK